MKFSLVSIFYLICVCISASALAAGPNLVPNPDFETPNTKLTQPEHWGEWLDPNRNPPPELHQVYLTEGGRNGSACIEVGHSYERFLEHKYDSRNFARFRLHRSSAIPVLSTHYYKFSVYYKSTGIEEGQITATMDMIDDSWEICSRQFYLPPSETWTQFTAYFVPVSSSDRGFGGYDTDRIRIKLGVVTSLGTVRFDDVSLNEVSKTDYLDNYPIVKYVPDSLTARRSIPPGKFVNPLNTFTVQKFEDSWWFVKPDGTPFWMRCVQFPKVLQGAHPCMFNNLPAEFIDGTSTNQTYNVDCFGRLGELGFNAGAITDGDFAWHVHPKGECYIAYLAEGGSNMPEAYRLHDSNGESDSTNKPMPDPYHPDGRAWLRSYYRNILDDLDWKYAKDGQSHPDFAGYYTDNEMGIECPDEFIWSPNCSQQFVAFVRARYNNDINAVNAAWSSPYATFSMTSFNDIWSNRDKIIRHHLDDPLTADLLDFTKQVLKDYYKLVCAIIREYEVEKLGDSNGDGIADQKHMIFTNRFNFSRYPYHYTPEIVRAMEVIAELGAERPGYYFDVLAVNAYPGQGRIEGITTRENFALAEKLAQTTGLPLFISDIGVHSRDAGVPTGNNVTKDYGWYYQQVNTQSDRAMVYDKMVRQWASSPYSVGAQWFMWADVWQRTDGPVACPVNTDTTYFQGRNCGLVDETNTFYEALASQMLETNTAIDAAFQIRSAVHHRFLDLY